MNKDYLERVLGLMDAYPENVDMQTWAKGTLVIDKGIAPTCGTTGCIAGYALALQNGYFSIESMDDIEKHAGDVLGLTDCQKLKLFFLQNWPIEHQKAYVDAITPRERTDAVISRVRDFMTTE